MYGIPYQGIVKTTYTINSHNGDLEYQVQKTFIVVYKNRKYLKVGQFFPHFM